MVLTVGASIFLGVVLPLTLLDGTLDGDFDFKSALVGVTLGVTLPPPFLLGVTCFSTVVALLLF
jgi:hypothetical protein